MTFSRCVYEGVFGRGWHMALWTESGRPACSVGELCPIRWDLDRKKESPSGALLHWYGTPASPGFCNLPLLMNMALSNSCFLMFQDTFPHTRYDLKPASLLTSLCTGKILSPW